MKKGGLSLKNKRFRIVFSILAALCVFFSASLNVSAVPAFYDDVPEPFHGNEGANEDAVWYSEAVWWLEYAHIFVEEVLPTETDPETGFWRFHPEWEVTRGQFIGLLGRVVNECSNIHTIDFVMEPKEYLQWAVENHILYGKENGLAENDDLTRQEMAVFLIRFAEYMETEITETETPGKFADSGAVSGWAKKDMEKACRLKLINGAKGADGTCFLRPKRTVTRAEAAQAIYNYTRAAGLILPSYDADVVSEW